MSKTLTIRLPESQDEALAKRAKALGTTRSALVRQLIDKGLEAQPMGRSIGHLKGRLGLAKPVDGWRRRIKERNWR
jgi:hypothetical protein